MPCPADSKGEERPNNDQRPGIIGGVEPPAPSANLVMETLATPQKRPLLPRKIVPSCPSARLALDSGLLRRFRGRLIGLYLGAERLHFIVRHKLQLLTLAQHRHLPYHEDRGSAPPTACSRYIPCTHPAKDSETSQHLTNLGIVKQPAPRSPIAVEVCLRFDCADAVPRSDAVPRFDCY